MDSWKTEQLMADDTLYGWCSFISIGEWRAPDHEPIAPDRRGRKCGYFTAAVIISINQLNTALNILTEAIQILLTQKKQQPKTEPKIA